MAQVFISYSRKDLPFVEHLAADLKEAGLDVWYDVSRLGGGSRWRVEIENALRNSQFVVVVLSPDSVTSEWVEREFLFASSLGLVIIPLMYRSCVLPLNYVNINYIDVQGSNYAQNFNQLLDGLKVDEDTIRSLPKRSWIGRRSPYAFLIGGVTIILAALLGLPMIREAFSPMPTPTSPPTATPTIAIASRTAAPTVTATPTWEQGKIAYVARNSEKVYFLYTQELSPEGQPRLLLSPDDPVSSRFYAPWFSPDGQKLAFSDLYTGRIFVLDVTRKGVPTLAGKCYSPSFAPDGTRVVCDLNGSEFFHVYDVNTGINVRTLHHGKTGSVLPAWSPDGEEIAFSIIEENGVTSIWKMNIDDGVVTPLASVAGENYAPSWSPDGEWIAYQSTQNSTTSEVWIMRRDGSDKQQVTFSGGGGIWSRGPCFSPDGNWLAFVSNRNGSDGSDFGDVFIVSLLTGDVRQVTDTGGHVLDWRVTWTK